MEEIRRIETVAEYNGLNGFKTMHPQVAYVEFHDAPQRIAGKHCYIAFHTSP